MRTAFFLVLVMTYGRPVLADEPVRVAVDWSRVPDATIQRCRFGGLQSLLLQTLIEAGYAVVDVAGPAGIDITIREQTNGLEVYGATTGAQRSRRVRLPQRCDGTIGVELQSAVRAVADELRALIPDAEPTAPQPLVAPPRESPVTASETRVEPPSRWHVALGAGVVGSSASQVFIAPVVRLERRSRPVTLAVQLDVPIRSSHDVTAAEPTLSIGVERRLIHAGPVFFSVGAMAGLLGHIYSADGSSGGHVDARFGIPVSVQLAPMTLSVGPVMRLRPVTYTADDAIAYTIDRFGMMATLTFGFDV